MTEELYQKADAIRKQTEELASLRRAVNNNSFKVVITDNQRCHKETEPAPSVLREVKQLLLDSIEEDIQKLNEEFKNL